MDTAQTFDFRGLEFGELFADAGEFERFIEWSEVTKRIRAAIFETGTDTEDIAAILGIDFGSPDCIEKCEQLPKFKTALTVSAFLGVPALWVLTGRGEKPSMLRQSAPNVFRDASANTVVQGNNAGTLIVQNGAEQMSEQKRELLRIFDRLSIRNQTKLLHIAYEIEDSRQGPT